MSIALEPLLRAACPFSTIDPQGKTYDGLSISQSPTCLRCKDRACATLKGQTAQEVEHVLCRRGLSVVIFRWPFATVTCNGILVEERNTLPNPDLRRANRSQRVHWDALARFHASVLPLKTCLEETAEAQASESINSLHDVRTAVSLVTRNAEAIVMSLPGYTDDDRIEQAPPELKSLLKSVRLLHTRLAMSSLLTNPDSASFGSRRATPVYKVFDRMVRLSNEQALQKKITLRMTGSSYSQPKCYDSFETIPLVLIDNAIKYSCEGRSVEVHVTDSVGAGVSVSVHSFGPVVPVEYQERIFERAVRAPSAKTFASKGSGLGLYFAAIVAQAHGFKISYLGSSDARDPSMGNNTFFFMVGDS